MALESFLNTLCLQMKRKTRAGAGQAPDSQGLRAGGVRTAPFPASSIRAGPPTLQMAPARQRPSISLQSSLLTIGFPPSSPVIWGGSADVLWGWNDSHVSPQGSSPPGFCTSLGKPYGCRLTFSAWIQTPKRPRPQQKPCCCLS